MYQIRTLNKIAPIGLENLPQDSYEIGDQIQDPDGILVRSASMHDMTFGSNLKAIARAGAGVNNIPLDTCTQQGIVVFNTPGANANAVKELVIAGLLISSRKIVDGIYWAQTLQEETESVPKVVEKAKSQFAGPEILGKTIGIIGLGAIGVQVANACHALGMNVIGYDPFISIDAAWNLSRSIKKAPSIDALYEQADYISMHIPLNEETRAMINQDVLHKMKDGVRILNFSRGELVDNESVKTGINDGKVSMYVTDFPTEELLGYENIITIPHLGASTPESEDNCAMMASQELKLYLEEGSIVNSVNYPECQMPYTGKTRISLLHMNIPKIMGRITNVLAARNINIDNMLNKSRDQYAYTLIDVDDSHLDAAYIDEVVKELTTIEGLLRIRVI